jgi:crooked neck
MHPPAASPFPPPNLPPPQYIAFERALGEVDRCRALYSKYLELYPETCDAWKRFAELEAGVGEADRARALLELAVAQDELDMPEVLWKHFIDFEISQGEGSKARELYGKLLEKTVRSTPAPNPNHANLKR